MASRSTLAGHFSVTGRVPADKLAQMQPPCVYILQVDFISVLVVTETCWVALDMAQAHVTPRESGP